MEIYFKISEDEYNSYKDIDAETIKKIFLEKHNRCNSYSGETNIIRFELRNEKINDSYCVFFETTDINRGGGEVVKQIKKKNK